MDYESWRAVSGTLGLLIFVGLFAGVLVYALWPKNRVKFDCAARLPLDDDPHSNSTHTRGGRCG